MSLHLNIEEYECKKCKTKFLPYYKGLFCPKCYTQESSEIDLPAYNFINNQIAVMIGHKRKYKQFTPPAWYSGSYSDQIQSIIFGIFDRKYHRNENVDLIDEALSVRLYDGNGKVFENGVYLGRLFRAIDKKLLIKLKEYEEEEMIKAQIKEDKKLKNRIKKFLNNIKIKYFTKTKCLCTEPLCSKCLSTTCKDNKCLIHTRQAKERWWNNYRNSEF